MTALDTALEVPFVVNGRTVFGAEVEHTSRDLDVSFSTPALDLDALVVPRSRPGPAFDLPVMEIIAFLVETGRRLTLADNPHVQECVELALRVNPLPRRIVENLVAQAAATLSQDRLEFMVEQELGGPDRLDGWVTVTEPGGRRTQIRAFPPRLVHVLPGNAPMGAAVVSIARGALVKGINLFKMPSNDLYSATAVLRTMAEVDPRHPVLESMSAVYWRGGDESIESVLYRPQYFDKLVAWGGGGAVSNAARYVGPGFQLVSFDPKVSMSIVGRAAFESPATMRRVADLAAIDVTELNQEACLSSRHVIVEGDVEQVDELCELLIERLGVDRKFGSAVGPPVPMEIREQLEVLRHLEPAFRVWGVPHGRGMVVRSDDPVDFHPTAKTVNVIPVDSARDAVGFASVATQTVGVYPARLKTELRNALATAGVQRVVPLGAAGAMLPGNPHDGMYPLHRLVHWMADEDVDQPDVGEGQR